MATSKNSKAAAEARARAAQLQARERRAQQRNTLIAVGAIVAVAVVLIFVVKTIIGSASADLYDSGDLKQLSVADSSGGILINQDGSLGGTPPDGAVRVDVYLDLMCPICHQFEQLNGDDLTTLRENGTIALYYHPVAILNRYSQGTMYSTRAAAALATVAEYDPSHFHDFLMALFQNQPAENSRGLTNLEIEDVARGIGVPDDVVARFADGEFTRWVTAATDQSSKDGLQGTPWIRADEQADINGGIWGTPGSLTAALQYIHTNGVQAFLDAVAAAQAGATPTP